MHMLATALISLSSESSWLELTEVCSSADAEGSLQSTAAASEAAATAVRVLEVLASADAAVVKRPPAAAADALEVTDQLYNDIPCGAALPDGDAIGAPKTSLLG